MTAHHIVPRDDGGGDYLRNLIALCDKCHDYVEIAGFRTLAEITSQDDDPIIKCKPRKDSNETYSFERPEWHKWVYGGGKRPGQDAIV